MPKRRDLHPENELIDELTGEKTPSHGGSAHGEVNRRVGQRAEARSISDPDNREPAIGSDNPAQDAMKGPKTMRAIKKGKAN